MRKTLKKRMICVLAVILAVVQPAALPLAGTCGRAEAASSIKLSKKTLTLAVKGTAALKVTGTTKTVKWSSSDKSIATVKNGKVTAKRTGKATITAKVGSKKLTCKVTVSKKENYSEVYKKILESGTFSYSDKTGRHSIKVNSFYALDIDKNGTPELLFCENGMYPIHVITVKNGKAIYCGAAVGKGIVTGFSFSSKYKAIYSDYTTNGVGGYGRYLWKMSGHTLKAWKHAYAQDKGTGAEYYFGNDSYNKVSESYYISALKKYFTSSDFKYYQFLSNTEANRTKILK